ncbi:hypothetical protein [Xylanimonas ulmi]|uniref:hypothetical protein n=1 Tax=Xylanimonas ulmi TaxID=228973 RepID=UPI001A90DB85|nr:hypothetical protein [Xylanibacterium ulmi]
MRTVLKLRRVGLSLPEVIAAMAPKKSPAHAIVTAKIAALEVEILRRQEAITFLQHTADCRHRYLDDCPDCASFVRETPRDPEDAASVKGHLPGAAEVLKHPNPILARLRIGQFWSVRPRCR